jgi:hypothetical protein
MKKVDKLISKIKQLGYQIGPTFYTDQGQFDKGVYDSRYWYIPNENHKLRNTPFSYKLSNEFVHFTSIEALFSILNTGYIRLYNLLNMDDKYELEYAIRELSFNNPKTAVRRAKEQIFTLSMCAAKDVLTPENELTQHLLWKLHGRNGYGVMLRFVFENDMDLWNGFHLTKVFYNSSHFEMIRELHSKTHIEILDLKLAAFLKLPIYEFENEVRLVFDTREATKHRIDGKDIYPIIFPDKMHKSEKVLYYQLPLLGFDHPDELFLAPNMMRESYEIPKIKIKEVHLGYRFSEEQKNNLLDKFDFTNVDIEVKISDLSQYY